MDSPPRKRRVRPKCRTAFTFKVDAACVILFAQSESDLFDSPAQQVQTLIRRPGFSPPSIDDD